MKLPPIVAITPGDSRALGPWIAALGHAGLPALLVREPHRTPDDVQRILEVALRHIPTVWLHARTPHHEATRRSIAGLHLPDQNRPAPAGHPWGRSCHDVQGVRSAWLNGASWTFLSPIHPPTSKPDDRRPPLGVAVFEQLRGPVYALGGQTPERHGEVLRAGAAGSAVLGDLFGRDTPAHAARRLESWLAQNAKSSS